MKTRSPVTLFLLVLLAGSPGLAISTETPSEGDHAAEQVTSIGDVEAGEARYNQSCINCHGPAGRGVASYPKIAGNEIADTISKLETYRDGIKVGPNSSLMIMMAKPLTDEEILNLATYLKDAQ